MDPLGREMILKTINLTFCRYIAVNETLHYVPHPSDPAKTLLKQEAIVTVKGVPLNTYMEDLLTNKISLNAGKGRQAMEWVIGKLDAEVKDFASSAVKSTDELLHQTKKSLDDISHKAMKSLDQIPNIANGQKCQEF